MADKKTQSEGKKTAAEKKAEKQEVKHEPFPLETLVTSYMQLSKVFSKLDRKTFLRLQRTNKTMFNFVESNRNTIKPNLLRGEVLEVDWRGLHFGNIYLHTRTTEWDGIGNFHAVEDVFAIVSQKKLKGNITKKDFCDVMRGSQPKQLVYESPHSAHFDLIKELNFPPGFILTLPHKGEREARTIVGSLRPRELTIIGGITSHGRDEPSTFMFESLILPEFECVEKLKIHSMRFYPESIYVNMIHVPNRNQLQQWVEEQEERVIEIGLGGILERVKEFEMEAGFRSYPIVDLRKGVENWCAGLNKLENFTLYDMAVREAVLPNLWEIVCNVQATTVTYSQLPTIMKAAFDEDTVGQDPKDPAVELRLLTCPRKKKTAYIYTAPWGTFGFRTFDFYPERK